MPKERQYGLARRAMLKSIVCAWLRVGHQNPEIRDRISKRIWKYAEQALVNLFSGHKKEASLTPQKRLKEAKSLPRWGARL